ncbi:MAG: hypothetical protein JXA92_10390, partial [candidate division Zixibacteria bacterium]|nr:hypothetical protein [candidate division Zixibacteria bacterium]
MLKSLFNRYATVFGLVILFLPGLLAGAEPKPEYYGLSLAVPVTAPVMDSTINLPYNVNRIYVDLLLLVDRAGEVTEVSAAAPVDSNYAEYYRDYLRTMRFQPGTFNKKPVEQILPVRLVFKAHQRLPELTFPVDRDGLIPDRDFYFAAVGLNGIDVPRIELFPSYNYKYKGILSDSLNYPYFLVKLTLDETGRPTEIKKLSNISLPFTDQIINVINWGNYTPLKIKGKPTVSESFLLISHLPQVNYPTNVYTPDDSTLSLRDRIRVRLLPDTVGLMSPPLPRNIIDNKIVCASDEVFGSGEATALVTVDTLGRVWLVDAIPSKLKKNVFASVKYMSFFPAFDYQGHRQSFKGYLRLTFQNSKTVGVDILWLSQ